MIDIQKAQKRSPLPILVDCPFDERELRRKIEEDGHKVVPIFIVEPVHVIRSRYFEREGRVPAPNVLTRAETIKNKVKEWEAFFGTSQEILSYLRGISKLEVF